MKLLLIALVAVGLCAVGYFDLRKRAAGTEASSATSEQLTAIRGELDTAQNELAHTKEELKNTTRKLGEMEEAKNKELAAVQARLEETTKQNADSSSEEKKKQMTELEELRAKLAAAETQKSQAANEAATAKTQAAAIQAEADRLKQLQARPPLGMRWSGRGNRH